MAKFVTNQNILSKSAISLQKQRKNRKYIFVILNLWENPAKIYTRVILHFYLQVSRTLLK
jgi:hypothetical protein